MPLSASFILLDFIVNNPAHQETKKNVAALGIASGYFCQLEYITEGIIVGDSVSALAQIAREYMEDRPVQQQRNQICSSHIQLASSNDNTMGMPIDTSQDSLVSYRHFLFQVKL